jgi:ribonuclease HI
MDSPQVITIATDASAPHYRGGLGGHGGWGWIRPDGSHALGTPVDTYLSIDDLELLAATEALAATPHGSVVHLWMDSKVAIARVAWRVETTGSDFTVPPRLKGGMATRFNEQAYTRDVTVHWVRGHVGEPLNRAADRLAGLAAGREPRLFRGELSLILAGLPKWRGGAPDRREPDCECGVRFPEPAAQRAAQTAA